VETAPGGDLIRNLSFPMARSLSWQTSTSRYGRMKVGIAGPVGSGKSAGAAHPRLYPVATARFSRRHRVKSHSSRHTPERHRLRPPGKLFSLRTIADHIGTGRRGRARKKIARSPLASLDDECVPLLDGYNTSWGTGRALSGVQKQRAAYRHC